MNIYSLELKLSRRSTVIWVITMAAVLGLFLFIYPTFTSDVESTRKLLSNIPESIRTTFSISLNTFFSFLGYYAYLLSDLVIVGAMQATIVGITMLNREELAGASDFLLSHPVSRTQIFLMKLAASITTIIVTNIVIFVIVWAAAILLGAGSSNPATLNLLLLSFFLLQLVFLSFGVLISTIIGRIRSVVSVGLGIVFGFYAISLIQALTGDVALRYLTPFKYFDHLKIAQDGHFEPIFVWLCAAAIIIPLIVSYQLFIRRDTRATS